MLGYRFALGRIFAKYAYLFHTFFTDERIGSTQLLSEHLLSPRPHRGLFFVCDLGLGSGLHERAPASMSTTPLSKQKPPLAIAAEPEAAGAFG